MNIKEELESIYAVMSLVGSALIDDEINRASLFVGVATERIRVLKDLQEEETHEEKTVERLKEAQDKAMDCLNKLFNR